MDLRWTSLPEAPEINEIGRKGMGAWRYVKGRGVYKVWSALVRLHPISL